MKASSKLIVAVFAAGLMFFGTQVRAQTTEAKKFNLNLGIEAGLPTGNQATYANFDLGGTVRLQYGLTNDLAVMFTTGGYHFFMKAGPNGVTYSSFGIGPVKVGLKEFFVPNIYFDAEAGIGREVNEQGFVGGQTKLLVSPGIGYANKRWDYGLHYDSLTGNNNAYGVFNLRIAYGFGL